MHKMLDGWRFERYSGHCGRLRGHCIGIAGALLMVAMAVGGCAESIPTGQLPDLVNDPRKFLSKEEQQQAISDLTQKKAAQEAEVDKQADKPK